jgi:predicted dienelactone hydrolase
VLIKQADYAKQPRGSTMLHCIGDDIDELLNKAQTVSMRKPVALAAALLACVTHARAQANDARPYAVPPIDAPALAALGPHNIGTRRLLVKAADHITLTAQGSIKGPRAIAVRVWYPASARAGGIPTTFTHTLPPLGGGGTAFSIPSLSVEDAPVAPGERMPLVIVSHGYSGWATSLTWLTENLATKGYIVVAIDHEDESLTSATGFALSFGNVLINRAQDQRDVIAYFAALAAKRADPLGKLIDADRIGLIGYSMGGYGALATSGADYDLDSGVFKQMPPEARAAILASQSSGGAVTARIKAVVTMAPWGGQPASRVWTSPSLARLTKPLLVIDGSADDIVDYKNGVSWIYSQLTGSDRRLLVFRHAMHNVGGNPPPVETLGDFTAHAYFADPVWRAERINAINQHFITAFLDLNLKGDRAKAAYLDVPTVNGDDASWPTGFGEMVGAHTASDKEPGYWRGFQRRTTIGLEMHYEKAVPQP